MSHAAIRPGTSATNRNNVTTLAPAVPRGRCCAGAALLAGLVLLQPGALWAQRPASYEAAREALVQDVIIGGGIDHPQVVQAIRSTPRHEFVAPNLRQQAYIDMALPIGERQTISSPYIVAFMTQALDPQPTDRVLEIGTGSGYQAAVLSPLVEHVYTIEIVEPLGRRAEQTLKRLKYENISVRIGDGYQGWSEHAPFDKIIVTCSPEKVPQPLVEQLKEGGRMVIPVGERYQQILYVMRKTDGELVSEALQPTLFVPMTGAAEQQREIQPDPDNPQIVNGNFEEPAPSEKFIPGWYYQRLGRVIKADAAEGQQFVRFQNDIAGQGAFMLQGLPIRGQQVTALKLSASVRLENVRDAGNPAEYATIAVTFYDTNRRDLGVHTIGRLRGTHDWRLISQTIRVPPTANEMLIRVGLFGATGQADFDDLRLELIKPPSLP